MNGREQRLGFIGEDATQSRLRLSEPWRSKHVGFRLTHGSMSNYQVGLPRPKFRHIPSLDPSMALESTNASREPTGLLKKNSNHEPIQRLVSKHFVGGWCYIQECQDT